MTRLDRTNAVHHVYRCFDADGRLIYVGSTANLFGRLEQHRATSWWAPQVDRVQASVYLNGVEARAIERKAIREEQPRWNKAGRWPGRHGWTRDQWDDWMFMLIQRETYPREIRRFAGLYVRRWGAQPPADYMASLEFIEAEADVAREKHEAERAAHRARMEEIRRQDEIEVREERRQRVLMGGSVDCICPLDFVARGVIHEDCDDHEEVRP